MSRDRRVGGFALALLLASCTGTAATPTVTSTVATTPTPPLTAVDCQATVGSPELVISKEIRERLGLQYWPDGTFGVLKQGSSYSFFAANSSVPTKTVGTLDNPAANSVRTGVPIQDLKDRSYDYAAGGPVYRDPETGALLLFYHAEKWPQGDSQRFYSLIGMAKSTDNGMTWQDLGAIVTPQVPFGTRPVEVAGGPFVVAGDYFYLYFRDGLVSGDVNLAVARAPIADVLRAARSNSLVPWIKYYQGSWSQPGLGGFSSSLDPGSAAGSWSDVSYNEFTGKYLLVGAVGPGNPTRELHMLESSDGLSWGHPQLIAGEAGENMYPSIVGLGDDPHVAGQQFYVYYVSSLDGGWNRWQDANLMRRLVSLPEAAGAIGATQYQVYSLSGTVPAGATTAIVGVRVNEEGGGPGKADINLYRVVYRENGESQNRVPNPNFADELQGWGVAGTGTTLLGPTGRCGESLLHITAASGQSVQLNSSQFQVAAGAAFTVTFAARVAPVSVRSGYFAVLFLSDGDGSEFQRKAIPFTATPTS